MNNKNNLVKLIIGLVGIRIVLSFKFIFDLYSIFIIELKFELKSI